MALCVCPLPSLSDGPLSSPWPRILGLTGHLSPMEAFPPSWPRWTGSHLPESLLFVCFVCFICFVLFVLFCMPGRAGTCLSCSPQDPHRVIGCCLAGFTLNLMHKERIMLATWPPWLGHMSGTGSYTPEPYCLPSELDVQVQPPRSAAGSAGCGPGDGY